MFAVTREELRALIEVALGRAKADLVVVNGRLVNVYSGEVQQGVTVAIKGRRIAYVGAGCEHTIGPETERLDAAGAYLVPGLIDAHTHQAELLQLTEFVRVAAPHGTTTVVTETNGLANAMGAAGVQAFLEECRHQPIKVFITAPGMVPPFPHLEGSRRLDLDEFTAILDDERTLGMGESFWPRVLVADDSILERLRRCLNAGKEPEGHAAGARRERLQAYAAAGISSCHESISPEDALERLRLGLHVMLREGSIRQDLAGIAPLKDAPVDTRRLILVTDTTWPGELVADGHMDHVVRRAVALGFDPVRAVQMATLNAAEHFGLKHLGGIAPGKIADLLLVDDLRAFRARVVLSDGRLLARDGRLLQELPRFSYA
ncbi:MAG: adenine deaminase, partial [Deltaproteobacteria bacterium]|nr:adenine deaminase [Deltaproteobacteria bacterium]